MTIKIRPFRGGPELEVDITVTLASGEKIRERRKSPVSTRSGARRWAEARRSELLFNRPQETKKQAPTLHEFHKRYIDGYARANRQKASAIRAKESIFEHHLLPRLGHKKLNEISDEAVQSIKTALTLKSPKTVNNILSVLNHSLKTAVEWNVIDQMPCRIRLLKVTQAAMEWYEHREYEALIDAARRTDPRAHLMVLLAGDAGLRQGEILALFQTDIDHRQRTVHVQRNDWHGKLDVPKGGRDRRVPTTKRLAAALLAHRHLRGERMLYRDDGQPFTRQTLRKLLIQAERLANFEGKGAIHKLRHTFCSQLAMRGAPARAIQEVAGHADLMTTQRYMHLSPAATYSAISLLEDPSALPDGGEILETAPEAEKANA